MSSKTTLSEEKKAGELLEACIRFSIELMDCDRSLLIGSCNSTIFVSRRFRRPIDFRSNFRWNETPGGAP